mmetsp:Transcript_98774/g.175876  ORF Transcript_98774/g.175876 Transcript_98774/m.175876 type:complete len:81 (+) Transcript_98774:293-535(+)
MALPNELHHPTACHRKDHLEAMLRPRHNMATHPMIFAVLDYVIYGYELIMFYQNHCRARGQICSCKHALMPKKLAEEDVG